MRTINYKILTLAAIVAFSASCSMSSKIDSAVDREKENMESLRVKAEAPTETIPDDVIRVKDDIWLGDTSEIEYEGEPVPQYLEDKEGITLVSSRPITLYEIGDTISKITSLKVRYAPELEEKAISEAAGNKPSMDSVGVDWTEPSKMLVSYQGPLSGLLDEVTSRFGIWWKYENKEIYFYKNITKTFVIYSLPTNTSFTANVGGGGEASGSNSISLSNNITVEVWSNIEKTITSMISGDSKLSIDSVNGIISLTATPAEIKKVAKFVNEQNARLSRQVAISVKVLQLSTTNQDSYGLDLGGIFKGPDNRGSHFQQAVVEGAPGLGTEVSSGLGVTVLAGRWTINSVMKAISSLGKTNLITSGSVTTLNNKPAPIQVVKTQNYIKTSTKTTSGDSEFADFTTEVETIETGFTLDVLPRILEHGRLLVMFNMTLSDLLSMEKVYTGASGTTTDTGSYIQNPVIESRGFSQEIAMKSGETLVLTGYERAENTIDKSGIGSPNNMLLGGTNVSGEGKTMLIVLLTPVVLESPLDPETRVK